jgi:hypothetical protein
MSEPLTVAAFDKFEKRFDAFVDLYTENHADVVKRLDKIEGHVERIENHLWNEQRLAEHERRIIQLAETVGRADLATSFIPSPGTTEPVKT